MIQDIIDYLVMHPEWFVVYWTVIALSLVWVFTRKRVR